MSDADPVSYTHRDELKHLWWRLPGVEKPRVAGAVDFRGARWVPASPANYRRADRPDDYSVDGSSSMSPRAATRAR